jgi:adenine-specific DNA-methyltransferase
MGLVKSIGGRIIDFVAQVEDFQKMLFEKRKFVTETNYCVTVGNIPDALYPEITRNEAQWSEWKELLHIDENERDLFALASKNKVDRRIAFLKQHPTLVLDTKHFSAEFLDQLLSHFSDIDVDTDGLIVSGENFQALSLLSKRYSESVRCVYIDPPFNTGPTEILYKNDYKDSSWLSLMKSRLQVARMLMDEMAVMTIAIDDYELAHLCELLDSTFDTHEREVVVVNHHPQGGYGANVARTHEYALFLIPKGRKILRGLAKEGDVEHRPFMRSGTGENNFRYGRPNSFYAVLVDPHSSNVKGVERPPKLDESYPRGRTRDGLLRIYPLGRDETERVWRLSFEAGEKAAQNGKLVCRNGKTIYQVIEHEERREPVFSNWTSKRYNAGTYGTNLVADIIGKPGTFSYPKSLFTVRDSIEAITHSDKSVTVLDFFAGSGTTGHAVIHLNREDKGSRKFILVEMADYFNSVLLPRIKKVTFAPEWKNGKPKHMPTQEEVKHSPRIIKYQRIESYEDALNNISFTLPKGQKLLEYDDYLFRYMLPFETRNSQTLLNVEALETPFDYKLILRDGQKYREKNVDLTETFNYLLGIHVRTRKVLADKDRKYLVYQGNVVERQVTVIWRNTRGWDRKDYKRDKEFIHKHKLADGAEEVFVNGDCLVPGVKSLDPVFKSRMFGGS